jgi:hypothetical protein
MTEHWEGSGGRARIAPLESGASPLTLTTEIKGASRRDIEALANGRIITTQSAWRLFKCCRRAFFYRYVRRLRPDIPTTGALAFGTAIHAALEAYFRGYRRGESYNAGKPSPTESALSALDKSYSDRADLAQAQELMVARAGLSAFLERIRETPPPVTACAVEVPWAHEIINPLSGHPSKRFILAGKMDGIGLRDDGDINQETGEVYTSPCLIEHKTASAVDADYLDAIWMDNQVVIYLDAMLLCFGWESNVVSYNVLAKPRLKRKEAETPEAFAMRKAALEARSKTGKPSSAKQGEGETLEEYAARLADWYTVEAERKIIIDHPVTITGAQRMMMRHELWELCQAALDAYRNNRWYQNTAFCRNRGKCPYWAICASGENPAIMESGFKVVEDAHPELGMDGDAESTGNGNGQEGIGTA